MTTRLAILGFLRGRPLYGYELKRMIERVMGDWTDIAFGSIYYALGKLEEEGFIEQVAIEQEGGRPSRTVYQITAAGQSEFLRLLREVWSSVEQHNFDFDVGLTFMSALPSEEMKGYLQKRVIHLEHTLDYLDAHQAEELAHTDHVPTHLASTVFDHHRRHLQAELGWTRELLHSVEQGLYDEEIDWMRGLFEGGKGSWLSAEGGEG